MIRVGRCTYKNGKRNDPKYDGFQSILVLMKSHSVWGELGPYILQDKEGCIMENIWQSSKCYETIPKTIQRYSRYNNRIIWDHPEEIHIIKNKLTSEYYNWREKLRSWKDAIRYPVGYHHRHKCLYSIDNINDIILRNGQVNDDEKLDYIAARNKYI